MNDVIPEEKVVQRTRWAYGLGLLAALGVLATTLLFGFAVGTRIGASANRPTRC